MLFHLLNLACDFLVRKPTPLDSEVNDYFQDLSFSQLNKRIASRSSKYPVTKYQVLINLLHFYLQARKEASSKMEVKL